jgi:NAD(P)H-dependent FMN reductase
MMAYQRTSNILPDFATVLILVGLPAGPVNRALRRHAIDSSPDGVLVHVFDGLVRLPRYDEALETVGTPDAVVALRLAATEADAVLVVTSYRGRVPSMAHSAIDWLTRKWRHGALHDKPIAVVGPSGGRYSGVWTHQVEDTHGRLGPRVIEPPTVRTLSEAVRKLADEVHGCSAAAAI